MTHLLVATKQLLETLTQWSRKQAQEEEVSDVYVRLGYEFNLACRAFNSIGVDTSDLGPVPDLLRSILEDTLSQPASPQALDNYLPRIRDIIINLLHGLKRKQSKLRGRSVKEAGSSRSIPERQASGSSLVSNETGLTTMLENVPNHLPPTRTDSRQESIRSSDDRSYTADVAPIAGDRSSTSLKRHSLRREVNRPMAQSDSSSSMSSATAQNMPVLPPYTDPDQAGQGAPTTFMHPPPPPPKQDDALMALQRGGDLERRASRRFSTFQISKHLGGPSNGVPVIPPAQNSPVPNRGPEMRESLSAVRSRTSYQHSRTKSNNRFADASPNRTPVKAPQRISEEREESTLQTQDVPRLEASTEQPQDDSPIAKTPDELHGPISKDVSSPTVPAVGATLNGPLEVMPEYPDEDNKPTPPQHQHLGRQMAQEGGTPATVERRTRMHTTPPQSQLIDSDSSPPQGKDLTLFLQYKSKVKKFVLPEGYSELSIARLQLAFIEKFAWNTHNNGVDLPEIYIQDPVSGVRHELEDLADVKDRSVLVLNVEVLDEVKKHFDDGIGGLRKTLESMRSLMDGQSMMVQRVSDRQLETSKEMARMSNVPSRVAARQPRAAQGTTTPTQSNVSIEEVQRLKRDIAVLRQTYSTMSSDFAAAMEEIKAKASNVKSVAADAAVPSYKNNTGRSHINAGRKMLTTDSETLVGHVDDLQDRVEDLRKDVVSRGVRPRPRQLEDMDRDITAAVKDLAKMKEYIKREKPVWTKIWEQELALVCTERDELTSQEDLMADLTMDIEELTGIFKLVEETTKQQNLQNGSGGAPAVRSTSRTLQVDPDIDPQKAKDGVLGEVRALQPNHENRLEAIERAEKLRQKELESRKAGEFQREVETFVEEGKLKKTGGADEVERIRKLKDERARRENWERMMARQAEMEARAAEQAGVAAAAPAEDHTVDANGETAPFAGQRESNENSHEGESAFEDATEENVPSRTISPPPTDYRREDEDPHRNSDGPPRLPDFSTNNDGTSLIDLD